MSPDQIPPLIEFKRTYFQNVGQMLMFQGMLVAGLFAVVYSLKNIVKELYEYVRDKLHASSKHVQ